jgi:hypothetical protein
LKTVVFVGPTLSSDEVRAVLPHAEVRPPVACGDVLRIARGTPAIIAIIDGLFEHSLPVWHKEILWALSRGFRVYGAGSMGALRAAELAAFGMIGVGQIFAWYRDGVLEDDDEVAIAHEDAGGSHRARSDAMVNVRATVARAVHCGVLDASAAATLTAFVKSTPYPQRDLRRALREAELPHPARAGFAAWLDDNGIVDQKRADAQELLARIAHEPSRVMPGSGGFGFSYTEVFHELQRSVDAPGSRRSSSAVEAVSAHDLFEELQLRGADEFHACWRATVERALTRALALPDGDEGVHEAALRELTSVLHDRGVHQALASRAAEKSALLASEARPAVSRAPAELVAWHFAVIGRAVPEDLDAYARSVGFSDQEGLIVAIARERWYLDRRGDG